ncbi:Glycine cleavage system transcriptional activator [Ralstonia edaphis]|uniref:Glycine cleavage system transcriptional activator n=1 Tax=Ralstonia edaphi TaxID=3058599 RepID=A0AB72X5L2_9RALS|nr:transcriptional regulator GcvA [Ralstonia sp. LMG 6871]CAJ0739233.1 Glycine cleavage system transcriptional activator [Ralstonia sp. LMG 6871]
MRKLPPLNAVRAFESAARHLSFTRAGEELNVTHGAISRQIQALEAWLGVALFRRLNRRVELTDAGQRYLAEIGVALDRISTASQALRDRDAVRILRVNSIPTFTMRWLIPRLSTFQMRFPRVEVRLTTSIEEIADLPDHFDVIIRGGPEIHAGFQSGRFLDESRFPVCSPRLLERLPLAAPSDLRHHTLLHSDTLPSVWPSWLVLAGVPNLRPAHALTFEHFYLSIQAAIDGLGVAMGPSALVTEDLEEGRLVAPFPDLSLVARSYYWYSPARNLGDEVVQAFCAWLGEERPQRHANVNTFPASGNGGNAA